MSLVKKLLPALCVAFLLVWPATAQVPFGHFVVAAGGAPGTSLTGLWLVDGHGDPTPVEGLSALHRSVATVAVDPGSGDVWTGGGYIQTRSLTLYRIPLNGRSAGTPVRHAFASVFAPLTDLHVLTASSTLLVLLGGAGAQAGLYTMPLAGGNLTLVGQVPYGVQLALDTQAAYVLTAQAGQPSAIWRWGLATGAFARAASNLPPSSALEIFGPPVVLIADTAGSLHLVDTVTGQAALFRNLGIGRIAGLRQNPLGQLLVVAETGAWHDLAGARLGGVPRTLTDVDTGRTDVAWAHTFASGCAGSAGTPGSGTTGLPILGTPTFAFTVAGGLPGSIGLHALGYSRRSWSGVPLPFDLTPAGAPGCALLVNGIAVSVVPLDGQGNGQAPLPIPNQAALRGVELAAQWWIVDQSANALGLVFSDGMLAGVR